MTEWKFINGGNAQEDALGNIVQKGGGVIAKACQKCEVEFTSKVVQKEIKQTVPGYKCNDCKFEGSSGDEAFGHTIDSPTHKISKIKKDRIVGYNNTIEGILSYTTKTDDDVIILCSDCNGK